MPSAAVKKAEKAKKAAAKKGAEGKPAEPPLPPPASAAGEAGGQPDPQVPADVQLLFPPSLSARQRAILHAVAERAGLPHSSQGEGTARRIALGPPGAARIVDCSEGPAAAAAAAGNGSGGSSPPDDGGVGGDEAGDASGITSSGGSASSNSSASHPPLTDEQLVALLQHHLHLDTVDAFAAPRGGISGCGGASAAGQRSAPAKWRQPGGGKPAKPSSKGLVTVEAFIAQVLPLLEMEREAEVVQVRPEWCG